MGFRNRLLNGDCRLDQRNSGASISFPAGDGNYCLDRWRLQRSGSATGTIQQSTTAPAGFTNSLLVTVSSGASPAAGDYYTVGQIIEGLNCSDLMWGTANAVSITIGIWVRSSVTGTYVVSAYNWGGGSNTYPATFTVNAANTWEFKTVNIPGPTSGTWATGNTGSIYLRVDLGSGSNFNGTANAWNASGGFRTSSSVNFMATTGATFYMTGVQFEAGTFQTAPQFERVDYTTSLARCQRYYWRTVGAAGGFPAIAQYANNTGLASSSILFPVTMRAAPTVTAYGTWSITGSANQPSVGYVSQYGFLFYTTATANSNVLITASGTSTYIDASIEL
jgi:hypothetical protein